MSSGYEELKNKIKDLPISEVIGQYLTLHKKGAQTLAKCPFHDDSHPSLNINDQKGMWYCFVDNMGGDAISFVKSYKNIGFVDAMEDICQALGWDFSQYQTVKKVNPQFDMAKKILTNTSKLYKKVAETGQYQAYADFLSGRNLKQETADQYMLGISPKNNAVYEYLNSIPEQKEREFALSTALKLGLIRPSKYEGQPYYDTFRERIIFPIWDRYGQVIGFTSKITRDDQKPKYLNSVESIMFNKSELLYGINFAKTMIRQHDAVILVEGNMDQITLNQAGFTNSVAIMGTALTENNVQYLIALTKNIYLCLDNDQGGQQAAIKANRLFMAHGITPKFIALGTTKDPDEFINQHGSLAFQNQIDEAETMIDVILDDYAQSAQELDTDEKLKVLERGYQALSPLKESLQATERIAKFADSLGLKSNAQTIVENYKLYLQGNKEEQAISKPKPTQTLKEGEANQVDQKVALPEAKMNKSEKLLLQNLIQYPELLVHDELSKLLDFIGENEVKRFVCAIRDLFFEIDEAEFLPVIRSIITGDQYSDELTTTVGAALWRYRPHPIEEKILKQMLADLSAKLEEEMLKDKKNSIKDQQKFVLDSESQEKLFNELITIEKRLSQLKKTVRKKSSPTI